MLLSVAFSALLVSALAADVPRHQHQEQYPQGYYPFEESPAKIPPKVRKPPYLQTNVNCPGVGSAINEQTLDNLCGDLNKGYLPLNPTGQTVEEVSYPFELLKRKTLEFFSRTLPILKADDTLPKVARYEDNHISYNPTIFDSKPTSHISFYHHRTRRDEPALTKDAPAPKTMESASSSGSATAATAASSRLVETPRQARGWCDDSYGVFCSLLNAFRGKEGDKSVDRKGSSGGGDADIPSLASLNSLEHPMTPCPSAVEYVTPVFAKNYQGVWRYVVQIPYEGYFTQTVEVVKCLSSKCEFMEGSCLASPRWVSLLVAEIYYPDTTFPNPSPSPAAAAAPPAGGSRSPVRGAQPPTDYNQHFSKRSGNSEAPPSADKCDGKDELGCYQVRLYYDWFLIPGSCKCWKNDFFEQYASKRR